MKNIKNKINNKIKNITKTIFTIFFLLIFVLTPILAEDTNVILVNGKSTIANLLSSSDISCSDITQYTNDNYWATDISNPADYFDHDEYVNPQAHLIRAKSNKMAEELVGKITNPFILLGFSQGGLRVRCMAQYIAKNYSSLIAEKKFKGFITLDSPNMGGYIAQRGNAKAVCNRVGWNLIASVNACFKPNEIISIISYFLSTDEQNEFENINSKLYEYTKENLKDKIDFNELEEYFKNFSKSDEEKGVAFLTDAGLNFLCNKLINIPETEWFGQILSGALELPSVSQNIREITSEFRPGSKFLNDLNNSDNLKLETGGDYKIKRAALIGQNGDLMNVDKANKTINAICSIHNTLTVTAIVLGIICLRTFKFCSASYFFCKSVLNIAAYILWKNFPSDFTYWVTNGGKNNNSHDLLIPTESQRIVGFRYGTTLDKEFNMPAVNHIVPDSGIDELIPSLRDDAKDQLEGSLKGSYKFINGQFINGQ